MKIYAIRHGETDWNKLSKIQGITDTELNETGINQAKEAAKQIKEYNFDLILSSPLKRAAKTAEIVSNGKVPVCYREELIERCFGDYEGSTLKDFNMSRCYDYKLNTDENNLESLNDLITRVNSLLDEIKNTYSDKKVLLVTHGGILRVINAYFNGIPEDGILVPTGTKNCQIKEFEY